MREPFTVTEPGSKEPDDQAAIPTFRVPPQNQEAGFLWRLQQQGAVMKVDEGWSHDSSLPPGVDWVLYPNGDLERIRI